MSIVTEDKRKALRQRVIKGAKIISLDKVLVVDCQVRNVSATGAQLLVENQSVVPKEFYFVQPKDNVMCQAKVVWRKDKLLGIHFTGEMLAPSSAMLGFRIQGTWKGSS